MYLLITYMMYTYIAVNTSGLSGVNSRIAGVMISSSFSAVIAASGVVPLIAFEKPMYYRERGSAMYSPESYAISISVAELPILFIGTLIFDSVYFCMSGMTDTSDFGIYCRYIFAAYFLMLCFNSVGHLLGSALPNVLLASQILGIAYNFLFFFSGVYIHPNVMPVSQTIYGC